MRARMSTSRASREATKSKQIVGDARPRAGDCRCHYDGGEAASETVAPPCNVAVNRIDSNGTSASTSTT